jgi:hypothetical protein
MSPSAQGLRVRSRVRSEDPADDEHRPDQSIEGFGVTDSMRYLVLAWEFLEDGAIFPLTAFRSRGLRYSGEEIEEERAHEDAKTVERERRQQTRKKKKRKKRGGP